MGPKSLPLALTAVALSLGSGAAQGNDAFHLSAVAGVAPERVGLTVPEIAITPRQIKLESLEKGSWRYTLDGESPVVGSILFKLETTPQHYSYVPVEVRAFYAENAPMTVYIYAVQVEDGRNSAIELFALDVKDAGGLGELFRYYQRAAVMSKKRLQAIEAGRELYTYDVQVFFKFLEIARELGTTVNLAPSDDVRRVRTFLQTRLEIPRDRRVVGGAIPRGIEDVKLLINQIDFMEIEQLERLWELIKSEDLPDSAATVCARYSELRKVIAEVDPVLKNRMDDLKKRVIDAQNRCITRVGESALSSGAGITTELKSMISGWAAPIPSEERANRSALGQAHDRQLQVLRRFQIDQF